MSCQKTGHCHAPCGQDRRLAGVSCTVALERFTLLFPLWTLLGQPQAVRRTVSIEVGMQNSGLAVVLDRSGFAPSPLTTLPGAISVVVHALMGVCW